MELRYIKYSAIEPNWFAADHDLIYEKPTLFCGFPKQKFLMLTGDYDPSEYLIVENIPKDVPMIRVPVPQGTNAGVITYFIETAKIDLHLPLGTVNRNTISRAMMAATIKALDIKQYDCFVEEDGNDILFRANGKERKFCGSFSSVLQGLDYYAMPVTFQIDYDFMRSVYRLDTEKMLSKETQDIQEIVIGVDEIKPNIDRDLFLDTFAQILADRFGWDLVTGDFTKKEKDELVRLAG